MGQAWGRIVLAAGAGVLPAALAGAPLVIEHQPLRCVVAHTHPWIQARAGDAVAVHARFRRLDSREWYTVRLTEDEDGWVGALPRPRASLGAFAYYVEAADEAAATARTAEHEVRVVGEESACGAEGVGPSVPEAEVIAAAPRGKPPLPKGFDEAGQEPAGEKVGVFGFSPRTSVLVGLGVSAAAFGVGLAVANQETPSPNSVELISSSPPPGSTVSLSSLALSVRLRLSSSRDIGPGSVAVTLRPTGSPGNCVDLWSAHPGLTADRPLEVLLERVLFVQCEPPFATQEAWVEVRGPGENVVFSDSLPLPYSFVP